QARPRQLRALVLPRRDVLQRRQSRPRQVLPRAHPRSATRSFRRRRVLRRAAARAPRSERSGALVAPRHPDLTGIVSSLLLARRDLRAQRKAPPRAEVPRESGATGADPAGVLPPRHDLL